MVWRSVHTRCTWFPQTWKVLEFECCLEKCLILNPRPLRPKGYSICLENIENRKFSLKCAWKWLYGLEKYWHRKPNLFMCCFSHWCEKSNTIQYFCHQIFITTDPVSPVFTVQITKSIFFCIKFFVTSYYNWNINCEYWNLMYGKLFYHRITHLQYARQRFHSARKM